MWWPFYIHLGFIRQLLQVRLKKQNNGM
jgi:hypothetical protein